MGNDENWIRGLRAAGKDYKAAPPAGLWGDLEADLRAAGYAGRGVWLFGRRRDLRFAAAAACAALVLAGSIYIMCGRNGSGDVRPLVAAVTGIPEFMDSHMSAVGDGADVARAGGDGALLYDAGIGDAGTDEGPRMVPESGAPGRLEFSYYESVVVVGEGSGRGDVGNVRVSAATDIEVAPDTLSAVVSGIRNRRPGVKLYATASVPESPYGAPVGAGAVVDIPVADRLGVEAGVEYTRFSRGGRADNYIGVPVRVNYDIYDNDRVRVYASAGGAVAKSLNTRDLQVSLDAALGMEYALDDDWGVFVEPGMEFYPGNGNSIPTIYKERNVGPEIRVGLRHTFSR